jgi:hypothetical protein
VPRFTSVPKRLSELEPHLGAERRVEIASLAQLQRSFERRPRFGLPPEHDQSSAEADQRVRQEGMVRPIWASQLRAIPVPRSALALGIRESTLDSLPS